MNLRSRRFVFLFATLSVAFFGAVAPASAADKAVPSAAAPEYTEEQKALLKALDSELDRFEALIAKVDDAKYAEFVKSQLDGLRKRRDVFLKAAFDSGRYDEIRYDLNVNYQRVAQWLAPSIAPAPPAKK